MISLRKAVQLLCGTMGMLLLCLPLFSQGSFGRILGTVTDQSGGVVSGATVTVTDTDRGVSKTLETNDAGEYSAPTLLPGAYKVRAEAKGFKAIERQNIVLEVGKEVRVDMALAPGAVAETITITESLPLVETTNATLGGTINNADIQDMPLNGRNYQNLVSLRPGVALQPGGGPWTQSTNEVRPDENVWMVDGIINTNMYDARPIANMPSPFSDGATILPVDAIQEFNLEENPKAEYGWKPGAIVNVGIKSGTNTLHGTAYGFYRSAAWDARNLFNPDVKSAPNKCAPAPAGNPSLCDVSPVQLKQFGGVMGGPIKKDKLFFFAGYEGLRSLIGNAIVTAGIPTTNSQGDVTNSMVDAINGVHAAALPVSNVSLNLACPNAVGQALPLPLTFTCVPPSYSFPINNNTKDNTGFTATFPNNNITDNGVAKIDYHINSKHSLNGMVFIGNYTGDGMDHPFLNNIFRDTNLDRTYTVGADWVWTPSSRLVNDARFGYDRVWFNFLTDDGTKLADGTGFPINTGVTQFLGLPNINITGFEKLGSWHNRPQHWANHYFDYQDNISYLMGKHTFRFGGEFATIDVTNAIPDTGRGRIDFRDKSNAFDGSTPLEDFFAGTPNRGFLLSGSAEREETWRSSAVFLQDDWRVGPKLTLNLGLRYSYVSPIHEVNGNWGNFDPAKGLIQQSKDGTLWSPDHRNFSPRLGFAYDPTGKGTTVVRGGFNVIYSTFTAVTFLNQNGFQNTTATSLAAVPTGALCTAGDTGCTGGTLGGSITLASTKVKASNLNYDPNLGGVANPLNGGHVFPTGVTPSCKASAQCNVMAVDPNLLTPYITTWSLGVTHAFGSNFSLEVGYVGNHGSRLTGFRDINAGDPAKGGARPFAATFPYLNFINQISNDGRSNYHSLQTTLTKRMSHGLSFIAGYTYAHGLDTVSLNRTGYIPQDSRNPGTEYASGDFDIRHRFTFTTTYNVPGIKGFAQMLEGWKLNSIVNIQTPQPWVITDTTNDFSGAGDSADRWNITGNPADFRSGPNSFIFCTGTSGNGPSDPNGGCAITSGVSGDPANFSATASTAMWAQCTAAATAYGSTNLGFGKKAPGCFVSGNSVITPPATGTFGNIGRNIFRDSGFKNVDFSVFKIFTFKERYSAQFRVEIFNLFNHPISANPYGGANGYGVGNDPSLTGNGGGFGCGCATADVAAGSPQIGSGSARGLQLGLKLAF